MQDYCDVPTCDPMALAPSGPLLLDLVHEDLTCVRQRDPAARSQIETLMTCPGVHAIILHRMAHRLWNVGLKFAVRLSHLQARIHNDARAADDGARRGEEIVR